MTQPIRGKILQASMDATLRTRHEVYGEPLTDMHTASVLYSMYMSRGGHKYSKAHNEAMHRVFIKIARIMCGAYHQDNYVDAAAYLAIAAECEELCAAEIKRHKEVLSEKERNDPNHLVNAPATYDPRDNYWKTGSDVAPSGNVADIPFAAIEATKKQNQEANLAYMIGDSLMLQGEWHEIRTNDAFNIDVGAIFRATKHEDIIWKVEKITGTFNVRAVPLVGEYDKRYCYFHPNSITHIFKKSGSSNLKCLHCPDDTLPGKEVCAECAMELGQ